MPRTHSVARQNKDVKVDNRSGTLIANNKLNFFPEIGIRNLKRMEIQ